MTARRKRGSASHGKGHSRKVKEAKRIRCQAANKAARRPRVVSVRMGGYDVPSETLSDDPRRVVDLPPL